MTYESQLKRIRDSQEVHPAEEVQPDVDLFTGTLLDAFYDLDSERTFGFALPDRITAQMCINYCELHGVTYRRFFYRAMKAADAVWFRHKVKDRPKAK